MTERGGRTKSVEINARFVAYHDALPKKLVPGVPYGMRKGFGLNGDKTIGSPNWEEPLSPLYAIEISIFCTPISRRVAARRSQTRATQES